MQVEKLLMDPCMVELGKQMRLDKNFWNWYKDGLFQKGDPEETHFSIWMPTMEHLFLLIMKWTELYTLWMSVSLSPVSPSVYAEGPCIVAVVAERAIWAQHGLLS